VRRLAIAAPVVVIAVSVADATVEEQRARLPPAAECKSPVAGRWRALKLRELDNQWYDYTLEVYEDPSDASHLTGMIYVDFWTGWPDSPEVPVGADCTYRIQVKMQAAGSFRNGDIEFGAVAGYELVAVLCGHARGYYPDHFTGHFEPDRQEFQSVNNDGGPTVNVPTVFRRIGCLEDGRKQPTDVAPPPFFPKHRSGC
jgi:hypothetical protein